MSAYLSQNLRAKVEDSVSILRVKENMLRLARQEISTLKDSFELEKENFTSLYFAV